MIIFREKDNGLFFLEKSSLKTVCTPNTVINRLCNATNMEFITNDDYRGANVKFWLNNDFAPEGLLFKQALPRDSKGEIKASYYGELVVDLIAYHTGLEHTGYYPCQVFYKDGSVLEGTLSPSYKQNGYNTEFSAENITSRFTKSQYDNNNGWIDPIEYNTVYEYIKELKYLYSNYVEEERFEQIKTYLLKMALLDFATLQIDRHWGNLGFLTNNKVGVPSIKNIPLFDNECSFTLDRSMSSVEGFMHSLSTMKDPMKKYVMPMAQAKSNAPLLGVKTSLVQLRNGSRMDPRKYKADEPSTYDIFLDEMSDEILNNKELEQFYKKLQTLPLSALIDDAEYFPESIKIITTSLYKARLMLLESALEKKRSENNENTSSL